MNQPSAIRRRIYGRDFRMLVRLCVMMVAALSLSAQEREPGRGVNFYSREKEAALREKEAALGASIADDFRRKMTVLDDALLRQYVERLGRELSAQIPGEPWKYTFEITAGNANLLREPAWFPAGYVFVPAELFLDAQDESELAGMLAHAIAHVAERHGIRTATRGEIVNYASVPLIYMGTHYPPVAVPLGFIKFARQYELEADRLAAHSMAAAGFDPSALLRYIQRVQVDRQDQSAQYSPYPPLAERIAALQKQIANLPARAYTDSGEEFRQMQQRVRELRPEPVPVPPTLRR
jgi:beta-barrel assembly-enhancing protease